MTRTNSADRTLPISAEVYSIRDYLLMEDTHGW